jgi:hypothetical protein
VLPQQAFFVRFAPFHPYDVGENRTAEDGRTEHGVLDAKLITKKEASYGNEVNDDYQPERGRGPIGQ